MEEIEMVQKAIERRDKAGELLTKVGSTIQTTKKTTALRRRKPKIVTEIEDNSENEQAEAAMEN